MALSGTLYAYSGNITLKVIWSAKQSIEGNYSTIKVDTHIVHNTGKIKTNYTGSGNLMYKKTWSIAAYNSTTYSDTNYHDELLSTMEVAIPHNSDGTLSGVLSVSIPEVSYWLPGKAEAKTSTLTASGTIVLDTIGRATTPTLSVSSVDMNSKLVISMPRAVSSFKHSLSYSFGSATGSIGDNFDESYEWTVPITLANQIPNAVAGTLTITCKTYSGATLIGTKSVTVKANVPASAKPTISDIDVTDPTGVRNNENSYLGYGWVKTKSKFNVKVTASGVYGSSIKSYKIVANGVTYTQNNITTNFLAIAGRNEITVTVTDTRGRSTTEVYDEITVQDYAPPTIQNFTAVRSNADGTPDPNGEYMVVNGQASVTSLNRRNSHSIVIQYRKQGATEWNDDKILEDSTNQGWAVMGQVKAADVDSMYEVQIIVTDAWSTAEKTMLVPTAYTLMDFNANGKGIAFGKVSTQDGFDVNMGSRFRQWLITEQGSYAHDTNLNKWGTAGYIVLARIEVIQGWLSGDTIRFWVRTTKTRGELQIRFDNVSSPTDTGVYFLTQSGNLPQTYYVLTKGTNSVTVEIIIKKEAYEYFQVVNYEAGDGLVRAKTIITFPNTFESTLRSGAVAATAGNDFFQNINAYGDITAGYGTAEQVSMKYLNMGVHHRGYGTITAWSSDNLTATITFTKYASIHNDNPCMFQISTYAYTSSVYSLTHGIWNRLRGSYHNLNGWAGGAGTLVPKSISGEVLADTVLRIKSMTCTASSSAIASTMPVGTPVYIVLA